MRKIFIAGAAVLLLLAGALFWLAFQPPAPGPEVLPTPVPATPPPTPSPPPESTPAPSDNPALEDDGLPHDKLFITVERQAYSDGGLQLLIPKLEVDIPVLNGVDSATLLRGVGLYDYAQLPGEGNRNVSIAGHRNGLRNGVITDNMPFYYVDTLEGGDYLYLTDGVSIYQYSWESAQVVEPDDWGPIYSQGYSCLTLTTCTPIGVSDHRLIIRGRLNQVIDYAQDYAYPANTAEEETAS